VRTKQDQEREQGIQLTVLDTLRDLRIYNGVRPLVCRNAKNGSFSPSSMNCISMDSIIEVFYHLNKKLIATKHIGHNNFVFQYDSALAHFVCNIVQTSQLHFLTHGPKNPNVIGEPH